MNKRSYLLLQAWGFTFVACVLVAYLLVGKFDSTGLYLGLFFIVCSAVISFRHFKQANKTKEDEVIHAPPHNATDSQKIKFYRGTLIVGSIAFTALTLIDILELNSFESGGETIEIYGPIWFVYEHFGYWPAILVVPVIGLLCILSLFKKISVLKSKF